MPIWIRLGLILDCGIRIFFSSAITSVVGNPLKLDELTANETRLLYARILGEVRVDVDLSNEAYISMHDGGNLVQIIEY